MATAVRASTTNGPIEWHEKDGELSEENRRIAIATNAVG